MKPIFVYITCKNQEEALEIAKKAVSEQLAACGNILPKMTSVYMWEGKLQEDEEAVLVLKSHAALMPDLMARVKEWHGYEIPAILALPIVDGNHDYIEWMAGEMRV